MLIIHKFKVHVIDNPKKRQEIKKINKELLSSCPNKKWKNVYGIPTVTKPCRCYFYDSKTDIKLLGCTDNNNNTHLPNDSTSTITSTKIH